MDNRFSPLQLRVNRVIFGTETPAGRAFDLLLLVLILASVMLVMLDTVAHVSEDNQRLFGRLELGFTLLFTIEYALRLYSSHNPKGYAKSFYGVVDLLSILPTYLALLFPGMQYLLVIRLLRVLRIFRILKLVRYLGEANVLLRSMVASRRKILVFFVSVSVLITIFGSLMYLIEGPENGFTSIPKSIYWAVVTITTVGYGDITPQTVPGQMLAMLVMLTGYSILAVPTGILTAELAQEIRRDRDKRHCHSCGRTGHDADARYCTHCGMLLAPGHLGG